MSQIKTKFITDAAVTNAKLANMANNTVKGNTSGGTAAPSDLALGDVTVPAFLSVSGGSKAVIGAGVAITLATETANTIFAGPTSGGAATPTFRALVSADIPPINLASTANGGITGTLAIAHGGTGQTTAIAAFDALSPTTTTGDMIYFDGTHNVRLAIGSSGQVLEVVGGIPAWTSISSGVTTVGTINSQTPSANGLVISGTSIYAQYATTTIPGMVTAPAAGALVSTAGALSINTDGSTVKINGSNALESIQPIEQRITLSGTDITNQFVDLAHTAFGSSASANSVTLWVVGGPMQLKTVDYTVALTGGGGGVTEVTFAGDLATGGPAALIAGDILVINYSYLA